MKKRKRSEAKSKELPARLERRVRVTFFLPAGTKEDKDAVREVIGSLDSQYLAGTITEFTIKGFTHSGITPEIPLTKETLVHELARGIRYEGEIFFGHWWSDITRGPKKGAKKLTTEGVVFFLIDYPAIAQEWEFDQVLQRLKEKIFSIYAKNGRPQEEIWIVKQDIYRYA